jgi:hypothetical protein
MFAGFILLVTMTLFNWDAIISRYNFAHYKESFVHLNFLSRMSAKTLPITDKSLEELKAIQQVQDNKFPFEFKYMTPEEYVREIEKEKERFRKEWESKNWRSWNWAEHRTYQWLIKNQ